MGGTNREQQIIDAHNAGLRIGQIAAQLGLHYPYVKSIVASLCQNIGPDLAHRRDMQSGSQALLAAIKRARAA